VLAACAAMAAGASAAPRSTACPQLDGSVTYVRAGKTHVLTLATCSDRGTGKAKPASTQALRSPSGRLARIVATKSQQTIEVDGKPVLRVHEDRSKVPGGVPGPLGLVTWSPDSRSLFYFVDPYGSSSIAADGLVLRALDVATGKTRAVGLGLMLEDYLTWCGSTLVLTLGPDRIATHDKRLVVATAPTWKPHVLWHAPGRAFGSVTCAPNGKNVAVLSQPASTNANFFATRWQLWRVGLDGSRTLLDRPPAGAADNSPVWSPDGSSLAFVRERRGWGSLSVLSGSHVFTGLANLGYRLGYYGHENWALAWST
jgi:hypothetical protein